MASRAESKPEALIFAGLGYKGYGIMRSLGRKGVPVIAVTDQPSDPGRYSRYCKGCYSHPSLADDATLCRLLLKWRSEFRENPVLFAVYDQNAMLLAKYAEQLSPYYEYHWVAPDALLRIINKDQMSLLCRQVGVLIPKTHITRPEEDIQKSAADFSFPCLVKPIRKLIPGFPPDRKNCVAASPQNLTDFYENNPGLKGVTIWQEIIEGGDENNFVCAMVARKSGEPAGVFCTHKLRQYPPYGVMCYGRSERNDEVVSEALKLVRILGYRGVCSLEFKYRPKDGRYYFIEMNTRWPQYCGYFADAGVNLPYLTYLDLTGLASAREFQTRQRDGVHWINALDDWKRSWETPGEDRISMLRWAARVTRADSYAFWNWQDPKPFLTSTLNTLSVASSRRRRKVQEWKVFSTVGSHRRPEMVSRAGSKPEGLILAGLGTNGYGIMRSLGREGVPVVAITDERFEPGRFSRYCKRCYVYRSSIADPLGYFYSPNLAHYQAFARMLLQWRSDFESNPVLFPAGDPFSFLLAMFEEELSPYYEYYWIPQELHSKIINKDQMSLLCQRAGVLIPRTHITCPEEDIPKSARDFSFPCLVKPNQRFIPGFPADRKNFLAGSPQDLIDFYNRYPGLKGTTIWQELLEGGDENNFQCTLVIGKSSEPVGVFCTRKLHQYPSYGVMSYGRSEENHTVMAEALKLVRFLGYRGIGSIEFKYQPKDGRYYLLEMNTRWPRSNGYFPDAGLNLQYLTYLDLTGIAADRAIPTRQRNGVYWICALEEAKRHWKARQGWRLGLWQWLRSVARADTYSYWFRPDPVPFLFSTVYLVGAGMRKLFRMGRGCFTRQDEGSLVLPSASERNTNS